MRCHRQPPPPLTRALRLIVVSWLLLCCAAAGPARAGALPYDTQADAPQAVELGLRSAEASGRPLLLLFGANWCLDCRRLDEALHSGPNAALMAAEFVVVKVDVGNFDHNMDLARQFGNPIAGGIPAAVLVAADRSVLYATAAGELADARRMSATGVHDFFRRVADRARALPAPPLPPSAH